MPTNHDETLQERYEREHRQMEKSMTTLEADEAQAVPDVGQQINRLVGAAFRKGELWERCQGKFWSESESAEFTKLRDETIPSAIAQLQSALSAPAAPQPAQPLTVPDAQEKDLLQAIQERDAADDYIDALLDEVLGTDRPEWSSVYGHADAIEQVRERMNTLMKPSIDKAWDRFQSSAAPAAAQPAQPLDLGVMELAESVGLIGPASRTDDLHEAIQRFHDLIVVNASIKAARHFADGLAQQPLTFAGVAKRKLDDLKAQGYNVVGYMLARAEADHTVTRGAIDTGGMVIWWNQQKASQPNG